MQRARTRGQSPWIRTFAQADYKLQYRGSHPARGRRHRRCRRRRWQIINIHYVLTKLSHKLYARGKNGIVDNG